MTNFRFPAAAPFPQAVLSAGLLLSSAASAAAFELGLPVACEVGRTCFVQNYVDHDPSGSVRDYACGRMTYDGHDGTDIRLPTRRAGVAVLAAADGVVLRRRDGVADRSVKDIGREGVRGRECGNGVLIDHSEGFQTQYCHLGQGSVRVQPRMQVKQGQELGAIGLSGLTEFQHLHLTVRRHGKIVDPFAMDAAPGSCSSGNSLWKPELRAVLSYRQGEVINAGFAPGPVTMEFVESGKEAPIGVDAPAIVAFVRAIGLKAGDVQRLLVQAPSGETLANTAAKPLDRDRAQTLLFAGVRAKEAWPRGAYRAHYIVTRGGALALEHRFELTL